MATFGARVFELTAEAQAKEDDLHACRVVVEKLEEELGAVRSTAEQTGAEAAALAKTLEEGRAAREELVNKHREELSAVQGAGAAEARGKLGRLREVEDGEEVGVRVFLFAFGRAQKLCPVDTLAH